MKTDSAVQSGPFGGRRQSLIEDARKERAGGGAPSPGPCGEHHPGFETKDERAVLNVVFALSNEKNSAFFKTGKIFEVSKKK